MHEPRESDIPGTITRILMRHGQGQDAALAEAISRVYDDLQLVASRYLAHEHRRPTYDTSTLVHDVYLQLVRQDRTQWRNRRHLFGIAIQIMRRLLVDRARRQKSMKHGGHVASTPLEDDDLPSSEPSLDAVRLDDALRDLGRHNASLAQLVEYRFFGGLNNQEIAKLQEVSTMTIIRRWRLAKAWLHNYLKSEVRP